MEIAGEPFARTTRGDGNCERRMGTRIARIVFEKRLAHAATSHEHDEKNRNELPEKNTEKSFADRLTQADPTLILEPHEIKREKRRCLRFFLSRTTSDTRRS